MMSELIGDYLPHYSLFIEVLLNGVFLSSSFSSNSFNRCSIAVYAAELRARSHYGEESFILLTKFW
ncbi:hypothetical protein [Photorhabdus viridis]|uniref:hypothetical protein n=1 Tax=Photorhabdus viridis TaxID=3163327 RepID=UPI003306B674